MIAPKAAPVIESGLMIWVWADSEVANVRLTKSNFFINPSFGRFAKFAIRSNSNTSPAGIKASSLSFLRLKSRAFFGKVFGVMLAKRVIPCLDVHDGQVTRGVQFGRAEAGGLRNVGDPVQLAMRYNEQGADEMVFFDITATAQGRVTMIDVIERTANECFMPLTVGGGLRTVE